MDRVITSMKAFTQLTDIIPASSIFSDEAPEKAGTPYLVITQEGEMSGADLCGNTGSDKTMFDVSFYCKGASLRKQILQVIRAWSNQADTPVMKVLETNRRTGFDNLRKLNSGLVELHVWLKN